MMKQEIDSRLIDEKVSDQDKMVDQIFEEGPGQPELNAPYQTMYLKKEKIHNENDFNQ